MQAAARAARGKARHGRSSVDAPAAHSCRHWHTKRAALACARRCIHPPCCAPRVPPTRRATGAPLVHDLPPTTFQLKRPHQNSASCMRPLTTKTANTAARRRARLKGAAWPGRRTSRPAGGAARQEPPLLGARRWRCGGRMDNLGAGQHDSWLLQHVCRRVRGGPAPTQCAHTPRDQFMGSVKPQGP